MELRVYESASHRIKVRNLHNNRFSVCLYSDESWMIASGFKADSHDEALDQFKIDMVKHSPMIGYIVYDIL
jgi:hypothetical protein